MHYRKLSFAPLRRARLVGARFAGSATGRLVTRMFLFVLALSVLPMAAHAQASPFDTGLTTIQTLFTGTFAKATATIAVVMGGYAMAHGEPGHKKTLATMAAGSGIAVLAVNVLTWMWGV
jgi:type IV secretory pathway VirB2 component (pilin)